MENTRRALYEKAWAEIPPPSTQRVRIMRKQQAKKYLKLLPDVIGAFTSSAYISQFCYDSYVGFALIVSLSQLRYLFEDVPVDERVKYMYKHFLCMLMPGSAAKKYITSKTHEERLLMEHNSGLSVDIPTRKLRVFTIDVFIDRGIDDVYGGHHTHCIYFHPEIVFCEMCDVVMKHAKKCAGCLLTRYCSIECHIRDWPRHKKECKKHKK